jgi:thymidylate synthase
MLTFYGNNINDVYLDALNKVTTSNLEHSESRVGSTLDFGPSYFEFHEPKNQILTLRNRNYNPYFAIMEAAWILSGDNSLQPLKKILGNYEKYSDDGKTLNGAYGFRIRKKFGFDQLNAAISSLKKSPNTRRVSISLYSPEDLLNEESLDLPCNTTLFLKIKKSKLDLTVINRSNDLFLGIPYNVFVFNCIQKYIAHHLEVEIGTQRHYTDCLHVYCKDIEKIKIIVQSNSQEEIDQWSTNVTPNKLYDCMNMEHDKILQFDPEILNCAYTSELIKNYNTYKKSKDKNTLKSSLPHDILGLSSILWLESEI